MQCRRVENRYILNDQDTLLTLNVAEPLVYAGSTCQRA